MAKITINPVQAGNGLETAINLRLQQIEDTFNDNVLWRYGVGAEPNSMAVDLDMAGNDILNLLELTLGSVNVKADILQNQSDIADLKTAVNILWPDTSPPFPGFTIRWGTLIGDINDQTDLKAWLDRIAVNETAIATNVADIATNAAAISTETTNRIADVDAEEAARIAADATKLNHDGSNPITGKLTSTLAGTTSQGAIAFDTAQTGLLQGGTGGNCLASFKDGDNAAILFRGIQNVFGIQDALIEFTKPSPNVFTGLTFKSPGILSTIGFTNTSGTAQVLGIAPASNAFVTNHASSVNIAANNGSVSLANLSTTAWSPVSAGSKDLGTTSQYFKDFYSAGKWVSKRANGASAIGFELNTEASFTTSGAKLLSIKNATVEKFAVDKDGNTTLSGDITLSGGNEVLGLPATPSATGAASKEYVDTEIAAIPGGVNPTAIINGNFDIWQRGTSFAAATTGTYTADRLVYNKSGTMVHTVSRSTDVPTYAESGLKSNYSLLIDCTTADASIAAGDYTHAQYRVEGYDYAQLAGGNATLSFWVKATKTGTYCAAFVNSAADRSYVVEYTVNVTDTWEKKTITVPLTETGGTWDYTNGIGLRILFTIAAGSTFQTTAGAWQTGNYFATSNQVNGVDNVANNFRIAQVKFETGSTATALPLRLVEEELALCQRYYQKSYNQANAPGTVTTVGCVNGRPNYTSAHSLVDLNCRFHVFMRTTPTVTWYSTNSGTAGKVYDSSAAVDKTVSSTVLSGEGSTGSPSISDTFSSADNHILAHWIADAEL